MSIALTCPHCETALTLPADAPARRILCPRCQRTLPHPERPDDDAPGELIVAIVPDVVTWLQLAERHFTALAILGIVGILPVWVVLAVPLLMSDLPPGAVACVFMTVPLLHLFATRLARQEQRAAARTLGWLIVLLFALLGVAAAFGAGLYALVETVRKLI